MANEQATKERLQTKCRICEKTDECPIAEILQRVIDLEEELEQIRRYNREFHYCLDR